MSKKIGVIRGGPSSEYEVSLKSGATILSLPSEKYDFRDIFIDRRGVWHMNGTAQKPNSILRQLDGVFNALHGEYGEDGGIQEFLDSLQVPYTGSSRVASAVAMNKDLSRKCFSSHNLKIPKALLIREGVLKEDVEEFAKTYPGSWVVKPVSAGSSIGMTIVSSLDELKDAVVEAMNYCPYVLIEEYIEGKEATCGVIERFSGESLYPLPVVEIIPPERCLFFDYEAKYSGESKEICPGNFGEEETETIKFLATQAHKCLGMRHYSRSDFIIHPKKGIYILETNSLPGLTPQSLFPIELKASNITLTEFADHIISLALE